MRRWIVLAVALATALSEAAGAARLSPGRIDTEQQSPSRRVVEIRSYNLKPGTRERFHKLFLDEALPMLKRRKVDVVGYGPSLHDNDSYFLMRSFASIEQRQRDEDAFYGSQEWITGPRERVLADIDSYTTVVIQVDEATLQGLRRASHWQ